MHICKPSFGLLSSGSASAETTAATFGDTESPDEWDLMADRAKLPCQESTDGGEVSPTADPELMKLAAELTTDVAEDSALDSDWEIAISRTRRRRLMRNIRRTARAVLEDR